MYNQRVLPIASATAVLLCAAGTTRAQPQVARLRPFKSVQICLPFNTLVEASPTDGYDVLVNADLAVKAALRAGVDATGILTVVMTGEFTTNNSIQVTVRAPRNALVEVTTSSSVGAEVVVTGFATSSTFTIVNNGATALSVTNFSAPNVIVRNPGAGQFLLDGTLNTVSLTNTGAGLAVISGLNRSIDLNIGGVGNVFINAMNDDVQIHGQAGAASLAGVTFNRGQCSVTGAMSSIFGSPCKRAAVGVQGRTIYWTCGMTLKGSFGCQGSSGSIYGMSGGGSTTTDANATGDASTQALSATSTTGNGFSQTITSGGGQVVTTSSSNGQTSTTINGQAVNTATTQCTLTAQQAVMAQL